MCDAFTTLNLGIKTVSSHLTKDEGQLVRGSHPQQPDDVSTIQHFNRNQIQFDAAFIQGVKLSESATVPGFSTWLKCYMINFIIVFHHDQPRRQAKRITAPAVQRTPLPFTAQWWPETMTGSVISTYASFSVLMNTIYMNHWEPPHELHRIG